MYFSPVFNALLEEAQFTKELLGIGVTQLYNANYSSKGIYYQSFTCLSTGLERLMKLCVILDYYISNQGKFPPEKFIRGFGHRLTNLFTTCQEIASRQAISFHFHCALDDDIRQAIISILSDFADSPGRYANINILTGQTTRINDCLDLWYSRVDLPLYNRHITAKRKEEIDRGAFIIGTACNQFALTLHTTEDNKEITNAIEASKRTGIWEAIAPYRQLYTLQIIRYLTQLLSGLGYKAMTLNTGDIPYFSEIFGLFFNSDSYFRTRKTWDKLR